MFLQPSSLKNCCVYTVCRRNWLSILALHGAAGLQKPVLKTLLDHIASFLTFPIKKTSATWNDMRIGFRSQFSRILGHTSYLVPTLLKVRARSSMLQPFLFLLDQKGSGEWVSKKWMHHWIWKLKRFSPPPPTPFKKPTVYKTWKALYSPLEGAFKKSAG